MDVSQEHGDLLRHSTYIHSTNMCRMTSRFLKCGNLEVNTCQSRARHFPKLRGCQSACKKSLSDSHEFRTRQSACMKSVAESRDFRLNPQIPLRKPKSIEFSLSFSPRPSPDRAIYPNSVITPSILDQLTCREEWGLVWMDSKSRTALTLCWDCYWYIGQPRTLPISVICLPLIVKSNNLEFRHYQIYCWRAHKTSNNSTNVNPIN